MVKSNLDIVNKFVSLYQENRKLLNGSEPKFLSLLREKGINYFKENGFPGKKDEAYKYLHLEPLFAFPMTNRFVPRSLEFDLEDMFRCDIPTLDTRVLTVLNGFYYTTDGKNLVKDKDGIIFGSLSEAIKQYPDLVEQHLGKHASPEEDPFVALNTACAKDGVFVYVPKGTIMNNPIQIIHLLLSDENEMVQHRNLFIVEENSKAEVIICDHTLSNHMFLTNSVTEVSVADNAILDIVRLQNEHNHAVQITNTWINQYRDSSSRHTTITLHGGKVRNNLRVRMKEEGGACDAMGLFLIDKQQQVDNFTVIEHQKPNCTSNQHYKGVLDDAATGAFSGKIHVFPDAQKTVAYQSNNNILLTELAKMRTRPQLEIYADDVKCSHGVTVGQIDENALFYLQSRGIPKNEARLMLMYGFANEVISGIQQEPLRLRIGELVSRRLRGELSRCENCAIQCND